MIIFNSDLDNTIIYSYKHNIGYNKVCVEMYKDRNVSFMTKLSYDLLKIISEKLLFVPTTTRTIEQYNRIDLGIGKIKYALVCNGGILLENGFKNKEWYKDSLDLISDCTQELEKAEKILNNDIFVNFEVRNIENLFVFTKSDLPDESIKNLKNIIDLSIIDLFQNGNKIYAIPKKLNKGNALIRFKEKINGTFTFASGDSEFDISMVRAADFGIVPNEKMKIKTEKRNLYWKYWRFF